MHASVLKLVAPSADLRCRW